MMKANGVGKSINESYRSAVPISERIEDLSYKDTSGTEMSEIKGPASMLVVWWPAHPLRCLSLFLFSTLSLTLSLR